MRRSTPASSSEVACGDGLVDEDENCDDGAENSDLAPDACRTDCTSPRCGDGVVDLHDYCDDGDQLDGGGCSPDCQRYDHAGMATDLPAAALVGWQQCWTGTYAGSVPLAGLVESCTGTQLLLACRPVGADTFTVAAHAPRAEVMSAGEYLDIDFVPWTWSAKAIGYSNYTSCASGKDGLCWRLDGGENLVSGGHCGAQFMGLEDNQGWERVAFHALK